MNTVTKSLFLTVAILLFGAASAMAATVSFTDSELTNLYFPGCGNGSADDGKDVVGTPNITGGSATFQTTGGTTYLTSVTFNISVEQYYEAYNNLVSGDLFIDTDYDSTSGGSNTWDYVVSKANNAVYSFGKSYDDGTAYNYSYYPTSADIREDHPISADTSLLTSANLVASGISFEDLANVTGNNQTVTLTISGLMIAVGDYVTLGYTVSCANDVVFETLQATPIPGAVWLLGTGLLGLVGLRGRFKG